MVLKKVKGGYKVFSRSGRPLSEYPKRYEDALKQLQAIEIAKMRRKESLEHPWASRDVIDKIVYDHFKER